MKWFLGGSLVLTGLVATTATAKDAVNTLEPVVVTATKTPKKLENVPAVVSLVTAEEIEKMPARSLSDLLANLPGVHAYEPQGVGLVTPQSITISGNGFPGSAMILLDGQKINTPNTNYAYLTTVPYRAVERVEYIRGPFSALYGSSAGGGLMNIITKDGGDRSYVSPWVKAGNYGARDYGLDVGIVTDSLSAGFFFDRKEVDNYYMFDDFGVDTRNRGYKHDRFHGKITGSFNENTDFSLSGGAIKATTGFGITKRLKINGTKKVDQHYLNFKVSSQVSDKLNLQAQLDWIEASHRYFGETLENITYRTIPAGSSGRPARIPVFDYKPSVNQTKTSRYRLDVSGNYYFNENNILTLGAEISRTSTKQQIKNIVTGEILDVQGRSGISLSKAGTMYSLYGQYNKIFLDDFELLLGARFDKYGSFGSSFSPKASIKWNYSDNGVLKLSAGRGFNAPTFNQLYSPPWSISPFIVMQSNPNLKAEKLWTYQLSLEQHALDDKLFFRLTPYYTDASNFISHIRRPDPYNPGGQVMEPRNISKVKIKGAELELKYSPFDNINFFANYNYNETKDANTGKIIDGYPKNSLSIGAGGYYKINDDWKIRGSYAARYRGKYKDTSWGRPPVIATVGNYWYHTAKVGLDWRNIASLDVDLFNITNTRAKTGVDKYIPKFNYNIGLNLKYEF